MNDLAMAALALTILQWNRTHDVPAADSVSVNMPVNFRPTAWSTEVISNFASYLAIVLRVDEVTDLEGDRHRRRDHRTIEAIRRRRVGRGSARRGKGVAGDAQAPTSAASPLGRRSVRRKRLSVQPGPRRRPRFRGEAGDTTEVWFSPTAAMSVMPIGVGLVGFGGTLRAMFRGDGRTIGGEALGRFAALYRDTLLT